MAATIIPFPGVNPPVESYVEPVPVSFDEARPGWEQEITDNVSSIEHADDPQEWVARVRELADLLGNLIASVTTD